MAEMIQDIGAKLQEQIETIRSLKHVLVALDESGDPRYFEIKSALLIAQLEDEIRLAGQPYNKRCEDAVAPSIALAYARYKHPGLVELINSKYEDFGHA